jgi:hypothetical protein
MEFLDRTTTLEKPYFQYDPLTQQEIADVITGCGVTVLGVDILPSELPRDSSEHFGKAVQGVIKELVEVKLQQQQQQQEEEDGSPKLGIDTKLLSPSLVRSTKRMTITHICTFTHFCFFFQTILGGRLYYITRRESRTQVSLPQVHAATSSCC